MILKGHPMKKKILILSILIIVVVIIVFSCFFFGKRNKLDRIFNITIPRGANISHFYNSYNVTDGSRTAAKIELSRTDYENISSTLSGKYDLFVPSNLEILDDRTLPPNSDTPVNLEKFDEDLPWWDLENEQIDYMFFREEEHSNNIWGIRRRCPQITRIYVVEENANINLYLYHSH